MKARNQKYDPKEEKAAEYLSDESYSEAYRAYVRAGGDILFGRSGGDYSCYAEALGWRINKIADELQSAKCAFSSFSPDDSECIARVLTLPAQLHYNEFEYVGKGGDYDNGKFKREEQWCPCEPSDSRDVLVNAIGYFCLQGATLSKRLQLESAKQLFINSYRVILEQCIHPEDPDGHCGNEMANRVAGWINEATCLLWGELVLEANEKTWRHAEEKNRADVGHLSNDESANDERSSKIIITLGEYSKKIIKSIDNKTRTVVFFGGRGRKDEVIKVPSTANKAWQILKCVAESTDTKNGEAELPEELRYCRAHFRRARKL